MNGKRVKQLFKALGHELGVEASHLATDAKTLARNVAADLRRIQRKRERRVADDVMREAKKKRGYAIMSQRRWSFTATAPNVDLHRIMREVEEAGCEAAVVTRGKEILLLLSSTWLEQAKTIDLRRVHKYKCGDNEFVLAVDGVSGVAFGMDNNATNVKYAHNWFHNANKLIRNLRKGVETTVHAIGVRQST